MSRLGRAGIMLAVGAMVARLLLDGGFGWFVQQRMRWPLIGAAAALLIFGAYELIDSGRQGAVGKKAWGPHVGWLLVLPLLVLVTVAPTALGAVAADRVDAYVPTETSSRFDQLPERPEAEPLEMRVIEFIDRAAWDPDGSLEGQLVRLEGLVVNDPDVPDGFKLTRFLVSCCAADGIPLQITIRGADAVLGGVTLENDTWVVADVIWRVPDVPYQESEPPWTIEADAVAIETVVGIPKDPYESPY